MTLRNRFSRLIFLRDLGGRRVLMTRHTVRAIALGPAAFQKSLGTSGAFSHGHWRVLGARWSGTLCTSCRCTRHGMVSMLPYVTLCSSTSRSTVGRTATRAVLWYHLDRSPAAWEGLCFPGIPTVMCTLGPVVLSLCNNSLARLAWLMSTHGTLCDGSFAGIPMVMRTLGPVILSLCSNTLARFA